jgi:hypothetical protein
MPDTAHMVSEKNDPLHTWAQHQFALDALRRVLVVFEREGIETLPVKGVVLAHSLYAGVHERPIVDVDLRIVPEDLPRATRALAREGWRVQRNSNQLGSRALFVERMLVEIETTIGPPGLCAIGVGAMLARSTRTSRGLGFVYREPEIHDHALVLCVNAFKDHLVESNPWTRTDLERLARCEAFDPSKMSALAREARLATAVWLVADWITQGASSDAWTRVRNALGRAPPRAIYARVHARLARHEPHPATLAAIASRVGSDDARMRFKALALGGAGTLLYAWARAQAVLRDKAP